MKNGCSCRTLHELFRQISMDFGEETLTESRLKGLLSDYGGTSVNKYSVVITRSISCQIGKKLLGIRELDDSDYNLKLNNLRQAFQEENFFRYDIANYIIDCYLYALELLDEVDEFDEDGYQPGSARAGELSFVEHGGKEYCGSFSRENGRSGFGVERDSDYNYYAGEWKLDMKNGIGLGVDGRYGKYAGEWRFNRKSGVGVEISPQGYKYAGEWKNGKANGNGIVFFPNGECMSAVFTNGIPKRNALGIYYLKDGSYVMGSMTMDGPDGKCLHYLQNGEVTEENWKNGKPSGY